MAAGTAAQASLVQRVHALLADEAAVREVPMFGGRCIMVGGKITVSVRRNGSLLVRVAADDHDLYLAEPGAAPAEMGRGRVMGPGWIAVDPECVLDEGLVFWIQAALAHNHAVTRSQHAES